MKIITVVGARPQFIKAAMLSRQFAKHAQVEETILHTGQHYDANMSDIFFTELGLSTPKYNLGIHNSTHGAMTGAMLTEIEKVLLAEKPDMVVLYGDTDSTLAGALAASKLHIPVAHIEAGLRSFNRTMPEEINRVVTDHVAELLFAPTQTAVDNLLKENRPGVSITLSGDIMYDAALNACKHVDENQILESFELCSKTYTLATLHRAENTDCPERLLTWLRALNTAGEQRPLILPLHPRTKQRIIDAEKSLSDFPNIRCIEPVSYASVAVLTKHAQLIASDSGGLQKEAYFHRTPCLILRNETEWIELIDNGWSRLVSCDEAEFSTAFATHVAPTKKESSQPFGNGTAAEQICTRIIQHLR